MIVTIDIAGPDLDGTVRDANLSRQTTSDATEGYWDDNMDNPVCDCPHAPSRWCDECHECHECTPCLHREPLV